MSDPPTRVHVLRAHITSDPAPVRFVPEDVLEEAGGWLRYRTSSGHEGWVPVTSSSPLRGRPIAP